MLHIHVSRCPLLPNRKRDNTRWLKRNPLAGNSTSLWMHIFIISHGMYFFFLLVFFYFFFVWKWSGERSERGPPWRCSEHRIRNDFYLLTPPIERWTLPSHSLEGTDASPGTMGRLLQQTGPAGGSIPCRCHSASYKDACGYSPVVLDLFWFIPQGEGLFWLNSCVFE